MTKKIQAKKSFLLSTLMSSMLVFMPSAYALQEMNDNDMRAMDGQDGITANIVYTNVNIDRVSWVDQAGNPTTSGNQSLYANLNKISMDRGNLPAGKNMGTDLSLDIFTNAATSTPGLNLNLNTTLGKANIASFSICQTATCSDGEASMGSLSVEAYNPIGLNFTSTNGLFSSNDRAYLNLFIKGVKIGLTQKDKDNVSNTLAMKNFNFNFQAMGTMGIDPVKGLTLQTGAGGYADFIRDTTTLRPGINLEFTVNDRGIIQAGANGRIINGTLQFGATDTSNNLLGTVAGNSVAGATGLRFAMSGQFTNATDTSLSPDQQISLELGGAGAYGYGLRFKNITALQTRSGIKGTETEDIALNTAHGGLSMDEVNNGVAGGVYLNLVNTTSILLPINEMLSNSTLGNTSSQAKTNPNTPNPMATASDFTQVIAATAIPSVVVSVRGMNFNAVSKQGQFIATSDVTDPSKLPSTTAAKWGLALPIYNLNANLAIYGKKSDGVKDFTVAKGTANHPAPTITPVSGSERIGFSAGISTQGVSKDGSKTTSIMLIDGGDNKNYKTAGTVTPTDYYIGLRNINMLLNGYGSIGLENGQINVSMPSLKMIIAAQLAAGYLPGARYKTCPVGGGCYAPSNSFTTNNDVLAGIKLKLNGGINFALIPRPLLASQEGLVDGATALNVVGQMDLNSSSFMNNAIQLSDPDGSTLGLDNLSGSIAFDNSIIVNKNSAGFNYSFLLNPQKTPAGVFRAKDVNLYPTTGVTDSTTLNPVVGSAQRLGEVAVTGGRISSQMTITPRDGAFVF
ncbi:DUF6160 family protein [Acinetobacter stercoris]|uniref:DUF6160 domain-containing protein n=1 Tax=Acinetobacter stercoris TaxID=2126983 RepID=A0A2U3N0K9_9GAMM|nr:DUF6160 family protein [Acinetobacter stercoris]SPL71089.1 hypothetical protein KPC_2267 [Acinetobacter stercoris]